MCFHKRYVLNQYTNKSVMVNCGHCEACMQEKANKRKLRLLNHVPDGYDVFFFHLTYADTYCPYVYIEDLLPNPNQLMLVDIYRQADVRCYYNTKFKKVLTLFNFGERKISEFVYDKFTLEELDRLHPITAQKDRIAVLLYKDVQDFFKRLRSRVVRNAKYKTYLEKSPLYYFVCGEYGENFSRCHWHVLLYVPKVPQGFKFWRRTVVSCWSYAYRWLTKKNFEYAISPQKYVAEYVNCSVDVSRFLLRGKIRPTWHYSRGFGLFNPYFQLDFVLEQIRKKEFEYNQVYPLKRGKTFTISLPFPSYVVNRFFPKFKGLWKISFHELPLFIKYRSCYEFAKKIDCDLKQARQIYGHILDCINLYKRITKLSVDDYIIDFINLLKAKFRYKIKAQLECTLDRDILQSYDNTEIVYHCNPALFDSFFNGHFKNSPFICNPNKYDFNVNRTNYLIDKYKKYVKQKQLNVCQKN